MSARRLLFLTRVACGLAVSIVATEVRAVEYDVVFNASWSPQTHPDAFPPNPHFSGLIGGTHNTDVVFWSLGGIATAGIESMAEVGSKSSLRNEVNEAIALGSAAAVLSGGGIPVSPGDVELTFEVDVSHSLVTLVSMIAPSPDWFVGVSGLSLHNGKHWESELVIPLVPYDAGTDSGGAYTAANADTQPRDPIAEIEGFPFANMVPLGTFTFQLNTGDFDGSGRLESADIDLLSDAVRTGETDPRFDVNGDGIVDNDDRLYWLEHLKGTTLADGNLDGVVDVSDFNIWNDHNLAPNTQWGSGDYDGDGETDGADFFLWRDNMFSAPAVRVPPVPEPSCALLLAAAAFIGCLRFGRRRWVAVAAAPV